MDGFLAPEAGGSWDGLGIHMDGLVGPQERLPMAVEQLAGAGENTGSHQAGSQGSEPERGIGAQDPLPGSEASLQAGQRRGCVGTLGESLEIGRINWVTVGSGVEANHQIAGKFGSFPPCGTGEGIP